MINCAVCGTMNMAQQTYNLVKSKNIYSYMWIKIRSSWKIEEIQYVKTAIITEVIVFWYTETSVSKKHMER